MPSAIMPKVLHTRSYITPTLSPFGGVTSALWFSHCWKVSSSFNSSAVLPSQSPKSISSKPGTS